MGIGPSLVLRGTLAGSLFLIIVCLLATANLPSAEAAGFDAAGRSPGWLPAEGECSLSPAYSQDILQWCEYIVSYSEKNDLDPNLLAALILQESGGNALAYSHSGAVGLMQVMPRDGIAASFTCVNGPCFASRPTIAELQDPAFNIEYGARMLAGLLARHGSLREALHAYGPMDVGYRYADTVLAIYEDYR